MASNNQLVSFRPGKPVYDVKRGLYRLAALLGLAGVTVVALKKYHSFFTALFKVFARAEAKQEAEPAKLEDADVKLASADKSLSKLPTVTPEPNNNELEPVQPATEAIEEPLPSEPEKLEVTLYLPLRGYQTPSVSPFPLKLETFLRVSGIPYNVNFSPTGVSSEALPWMTIGDEDVYETFTCIEKLCEHFDINFEGQALRSRRVAANLVDAAVENHLYWGITLWRWIYDEGRSLQDIQPISAQGIAVLPRIILAVKEASWHHALGRLSPEQVERITLKGLDDLSAALGKNDYFLGKSPGVVDCGAFAVLSQMLWNMPGAPFEGAIRQHPNLVSFVCRMRDTYWPDWEKHLSNRDVLEAPFDYSITPGTEFLRKPYPRSGLFDSNRTSAATILHSHGNYTSDSQATVSCVSSFKYQTPRVIPSHEQFEDYNPGNYQCISEGGAHPYAANTVTYPQGQQQSEQHRNPHQNSYSPGVPAQRILSFCRPQTPYDDQREMTMSAARLERSVHFEEQDMVPSQHMMNSQTRFDQAGGGGHAVNGSAYHRQHQFSQAPPLSATRLQKSTSRIGNYYPSPGLSGVPSGSTCSVRQQMINNFQKHEHAYDTNNNPGYKPQNVQRR